MEEKKKKKTVKKVTYTAKDKKDKKKLTRKQKRWIWRGIRFLIFLIIVAAIFVGVKKVMAHVDNDIHNVPSYYRGTVIDGNYCCYLKDTDEILVYSTSKGPRRIANTGADYAAYMEQLKPADNSENRYLYKEEVSEAMGEAFDEESYTYVDNQGSNVLYIHKYEEGTAIWLYSGRTGQVDMLINDPAVKPIAYYNDVVYARNESANETLCYRVSTSYSRQLISVEPFEVITTDKLSFWYVTVLNFGKGLIKGLKASRDTR